MFRTLALICALGLSACGPRAGTTPAAQGLEAYLAALRSDDPRPLYDMLTREQREAIPYVEWSANWASHAAERAQQADLVEDRWQGHVVAHAKIRYEDGQTVELRQGDAGWRLDQALVSTSTAPSAEHALAQLVTALERHDLPALFAIMSTQRREAIEERLRTLLEGLALQSQDGHTNFHKVGTDRHELIWGHDGVRYRLVFVLEGVNWRLDELHLGPDPAAPLEEDPGPPTSNSVRIELPNR